MIGTIQNITNLIHTKIFNFCICCYINLIFSIKWCLKIKEINLLIEYIYFNSGIMNKTIQLAKFNFRIQYILVK